MRIINTNQLINHKNLLLYSYCNAPSNLNIQNNKEKWTTNKMPSKPVKAALVLIDSHSPFQEDYGNLAEF